MLRWESHVGEHVSLRIVHEGSELRSSDTELVGDMPPGLNGTLVVGLDEGLSDRGGDHGVLTLGNVGKRIAHGMNAAPLPGRAEDAGDRSLQPLMNMEMTSLTPVRRRRTRSRRNVVQNGSASDGADMQAE